MDDIKHVDKHPISNALIGAGDCRGPSLHAENNSKDEVQNDSNSKNSSPGECEVCGNPASLFCSICCESCYCCKEHQKRAWKQHKTKCFPVRRIEITTEDEKFKDLVVTRDIPQGELFLKESPILTYPSPRSISSPTEIVCVECFIPILEEAEIFPCTDCGLELCSEDCPEGVHAGACNHKEFECSVFQKWKGKDLTHVLQEKKIDKYFAIGLIRALLLREKNPQLWEKIQKMNSYRKQREMENDHEAVLKSYTSLVQNDLELTDYDEDMINHVLGVLSVNSIHISDDPLSEEMFCNYKKWPSYRRASILFPLCSEAGMNCIPNAQFSIKGRYSGNFQLWVTANVPISKGSPVSFSTEKGLTGTFIRRPMKQKMFYRQCRCERCKDPTELGTFLSALKCKVCRDVESYCLQTDPLEESSPWECTNCGGTLEHREVVCIVEEISDMIQSSAASSEKDLCNLLRWVKRNRLHPNHFLIINAELDICQRLVDVSETNAVEGKEDLVISFAKHILEVADIQAPGNSFLRGHALFYLLQAKFGYLLKEEELIGQKKGKRSILLGRERMRKMIVECRKYQREVWPIFEKVPGDSGEYLMLRDLDMRLVWIHGDGQCQCQCRNAPSMIQQ